LARPWPETRNDRYSVLRSRSGVRGEGADAMRSRRRPSLPLRSHSAPPRRRSRLGRCLSRQLPYAGPARVLDSGTVSARRGASSPSQGRPYTIFRRRPRMRSLLKTPAKAEIVRHRRATEGATAASLSDSRPPTAVRRKRPLSRRLRRRLRCLTSGHAVLPDGCCDRCGARRRVRRRLLGV
jgi:hypothetical protein